MVVCDLRAACVGLRADISRYSFEALTQSTYQPHTPEATNQRTFLNRELRSSRDVFECQVAGSMLS